jgi:hypothetical protein
VKLLVIFLLVVGGEWDWLEKRGVWEEWEVRKCRFGNGRWKVERGGKFYPNVKRPLPAAKFS